MNNSKPRKEDMNDKLREFQLHLMIKEMDFLRDREHIHAGLVNETRTEFETQFGLPGETEIKNNVIERN